MKRLLDNLENREENHLLPFFWQHGEEEEVLRTYMKKIRQSGIRAVCIEARPHPDFVGETWWRDLDIILDEAKKLDMKLWILDDSHFPTGFANGAIKNKYPQYRKRFLKLHQLDFCGPVKDAGAIIAYACRDKEDSVLGVYLAKKTGYEEIDPTTLTDLTGQVRDGKTVSFSLPEGEWKVLVLVSTFKGGEPHTEDYLNPIVSEATDVLLKEVYEPHYRRYKEEFGKTILGFFSDEPRFGNVHGPNGSIGRYPMVLPWREDMAELLAERMMETDVNKVKSLLPLLFVDGGEKAHQIRYYYMDLVSDLYSQNFSGRLGSWCEAHGVSYIGHIIEDNNANARLGYGAGHFFRAMDGQHMAGIDVVLHQLMPGMDHGLNKAMTSGGWDGEFFHYVLGKLGSSMGHLDPKKQGRTMCEVFGAYGWAEGNRLMKWIADYMLVRGVNEFCPHAFDPKEYPDFDCPPHFYAHGKNPQFGNFKILMQYMNRLSHLLSGGIHRAPAAVLYHAEAEWSGEYMLMQKPCAVLTRNQVDFDILPAEAVVNSETENGSFRVNQEHFQALIVPYAEALPEACLKKMCELTKAGVQVLVMERLPERSSEGRDVTAVLMELEENAEVVSIEDLADSLRRKGIGEIKTDSYQPYLRYYHYEQEDGHILMLVNEAAAGIMETTLEVPFSGSVYKYDAFENTLEKMPENFMVDGKIPVKLSAYESAVFCFTKEELPAESGELSRESAHKWSLKGPFCLSFAKNEQSEFEEKMILDELKPVQLLEGKEDFAGIIRYETTFSFEKVTKHTFISLNTVYEGASVSVNGSSEKVRICPPYRFDVSDAVKQGENRLVIEVTTTLVREQKDWLSQFVLLEPLGITESIEIEQC